MKIIIINLQKMSGTATFPSNNGIKTTTCYVGSAIFAGVALVVSIIMTAYVNYATKDRTQVNTNMR